MSRPPRPAGACLSGLFRKSQAIELIDLTAQRIEILKEQRRVAIEEPQDGRVRRKIVDAVESVEQVVDRITLVERNALERGVGAGDRAVGRLVFTLEEEGDRFERITEAIKGVIKFGFVGHWFIFSFV